MLIQDNRYACLTSGILATFFLVIQIWIGKGMNDGLYMVLFAMPIWIKLHRKHEFYVAILYPIAVVFFSVAHLYQRFTLTTLG